MPGKTWEGTTREERVKLLLAGKWDDYYEILDSEGQELWLLLVDGVAKSNQAHIKGRAKKAA